VLHTFRRPISITRPNGPASLGSKIITFPRFPSTYCRDNRKAPNIQHTHHITSRTAKISAISFLADSRNAFKLMGALLRSHWPDMGFCCCPCPAGDIEGDFSIVTDARLRTGAQLFLFAFVRQHSLAHSPGQLLTQKSSMGDRGRSLVLLLCLGYCFFSLGMTVVNKIILTQYHFNFPFFLLLWQV
jgi:hypothetical protein